MRREVDSGPPGVGGWVASKDRLFGEFQCPPRLKSFLMRGGGLLRRGWKEPQFWFSDMCYWFQGRTALPYKQSTIRPPLTCTPSTSIT